MALLRTRLCCISSFAASRTEICKWARGERYKGRDSVVANMLYPLCLRSGCASDRVEISASSALSVPAVKQWKIQWWLLWPFLQTCVYPQTLPVHLVPQLAAMQVQVLRTAGATCEWKMRLESLFFLCPANGVRTMIGICFQF